MSRKLLRSADKSLGRLAVLALAAVERTLSAWRRPRGAVPLAAPPKKILVIKLVGIGDTVLMLTPLRRLRQAFPGASISALVTPLSREVLSGDPAVDRVILYDVLGAGRGPLGLLRTLRLLRQERFDCVIDFEQHFHSTALLTYLSGAPVRIGFFFKPAGRGLLYSHPVFLDPDKHMVEAFADLLLPLGIDLGDMDRLEAVWLSQEDESAAVAWLRASGIAETDMIVGIHPGSGPRAPHKRWAPEKFAGLARLLTDRLGARVVLTGAGDERDLAGGIVRLAGRKSVYSAAGQFTVKQMAALLARCSLFVSNDTGPVHISASVGTPTVGIFGPEAPHRYGPFGAGNAVVCRRTHCSPCVQIHEGKSYDCADPVCMQEIEVADVWAEISRLVPVRSTR